ncbi:NfeD family protein [Desmospora profundinema]|uniref:Membrane-bound ClpP family serine protease n=1 Tax=Desmospora profundinema TaxID=1571184 RepID=A0ABU1INZ8_9BACL|nr:NfeD family protein [Desmospora profundinema]MDR6226519.1 membrane-bound ClpP family serine protease [Desmospora profundinema]
MEFLQEPFGAGLIVFLAGMLLVTEFLVKARGLAGISGLVLLGLYAFAQNPTWNTWSIGLLVVGLLLLLLDGKLIQDGTIAGIGLIFMLIGLVVPTGDWLTGTVVGFMWFMGIGMGFFSLKVLPRRDVWDRIVLKSALTRETGYSSVNERYRDLIGKEAVTLTDFRPSGTIELEGARYSAISRGMWIKKDTRVQVVSVDGTRILVDEVSDEKRESKSTS